MITSVALDPKKTFWAVLLAAAFVCGWMTWRVPLAKWDEGIHASVSLEMQQRHAWLSMSYHDRLYTAKPPLKFWLTTPLYFVFGPTELAARFWSVLAGVASTLLLWYWVRQATGSQLAGLATALIFLTGRFIFHHSFRTGETDGLLIAFWIGTMYSFWRTWSDQRWWRWVGVGIGLLFMTKQLTGAIPAAIILVDLIFARRWKNLDWKRIGQGVLLMLLIAVPWHLLMQLQHGAAFWQEYIGFNVLNRTTEELYGNTVSFWWYWDILKIRFFPWTILVPFVLFFAWRRAARTPSVFQTAPPQGGAAMERLALIWAVVTFIVFSLIKTKFDWYILPVYPALALLFGCWVASWKTWRDDPWLRYGFVISLALILFMVPGNQILPKIQRGLQLLNLDATRETADAWRVWVTILAIGLAALLAWKKRSWIYAVAMLSLAIMGLFSIGYSGRALMKLSTRSPEKQIADRVAALSNPPIEVVGTNLLVSPNLYFYLRRMPNVGPTEVKQPTGHRIILTKDVPQNKTIVEGKEILERAGDFVLLQP